MSATSAAGRRRARGALAALALLLAVRATDAQVLRGTVVDSATVHPLPGVMVLVIDSAGARVAAAFADSDGRFAMRAPAAGRYRVRAQRIRYRTVESPFVTIAAGETMEQQIALPPLPISLAEMTITAEAKVCLGSGPAEGAAFAVWEEIRKALDATTVTHELEVINASLVEYVRETDWDRRVLSERAERRSGVTKAPFASPSADHLLTKGFIQVVPPATTWWFAPDARVLLSERFLATHCFALAPDAGQHPGLIGLAFQPVRNRRTHDIRGTLWVDAQTNELRFVEFHYTALPSSLSGDPVGGRVDFQQLPLGAWIIRRWVVRAPAVEYGRLRHVNPGRSRLREEEGIILEARTQDGTVLWRSAPQENREY